MVLVGLHSFLEFRSLFSSSLRWAEFSFLQLQDGGPLLWARGHSELLGAAHSSWPCGPLQGPLTLTMPVTSTPRLKGFM